MPPKEGSAPKPRAAPKSKSKDRAHEDENDDGGAAAAAARAVADESRRLVDVAVTRGVRVLQSEWPQHASLPRLTTALARHSCQILSRAKSTAPRELPLSKGALDETQRRMQEVVADTLARETQAVLGAADAGRDVVKTGKTRKNRCVPPKNVPRSQSPSSACSAHVAE
jgi:hypothetical protein